MIKNKINFDVKKNDLETFSVLIKCTAFFAFETHTPRETRLYKMNKSFVSNKITGIHILIYMSKVCN